ncbi:alpha/beta-hydrolase [Lentinus brumalis]|uniref:Alpha/beta-hydrolase n=1 Tax=Lentinus brumalis TaxID=2498619 RepID=A0A371DU81_9APHY|nr:alpha/beta-hydrolase [Polyporus brumalis]
MSTRVLAQDVASANTSGSRRPQKKSSFLSLRREQRSPASLDTSSPPAGGGRSHAEKATSPSSFHAFQDVSRPVISHPQELGGGRSHNRRSSKTASLRHEQSFPRSSRARDREELERDSDQLRDDDAQGNFLAFPTFNEPSLRSKGSHSTKTRSRTQSGPSTKRSLTSRGSGDPYSYHIRDSNSSTLSHFEDTPQTPVDDSFFRDPVFGAPVVVAAPTAGVETMDALVDGMNGYGSDDHFMGMGGMSGRSSKFAKSGFHPLYHPPLPTPPPGVTLGGALPRQHPSRSRDSDADEDDEDDDSRTRSPPPRANHRRPPTRTPSALTVTTTSRRPSTSPSPSPARSEFAQRASSPQKTVAPSISEIIRAHAPPDQQARSRKTSYATSNGHDSVAHTSSSHAKRREVEPEPEAKAAEGEVDLVSRSSVDTLAEEIQRTMQVQKQASVAPRFVHKARSFQQHTAPELVRSVSSPRSEGRRVSSIYSYSTISDQPPLPPLDLMGLTKVPINSPSQTIAQYLRSTRLTTLLHLTRSPHASRGNPLKVSLSDLGSPTGFPVVVFLGLGCVRHIMGLYDEMAECLGIRLITIDRWGLGRTDVPKSKSARGIPEWASIVEEVLDQLGIDQCSIMAHSAGAPYAMAFANRYPERIRGEVCLLAPWVAGGEGGGYKWLKYVPNGLLRTAQAAEWKVQAWMLGKPPTIAFEGIGFDAKSPVCSPSQSAASSSSALVTPQSPPHSASTITPSKVAQQDQDSRPSISSAVFSEYDDLRDFEGRFDSLSTLGRNSSSSHRDRTISESKFGNGHVAARKSSRGFLGRFKIPGSSNQQPQSSSSDKLSSGPGKKLKALRSMGSLKGRSRASAPKTSDPPVPTPSWIPSPVHEVAPEVGLGLDHFDWTDPAVLETRLSSPGTARKHNDLPPLDLSHDTPLSSPRANGRRSISFSGASPSPSISYLQSPHTTTAKTTPTSTPTSAQSFQASLGNALIAASHAESAKGTHSDLLQILNHDRLPFGFSYTAYPHNVRVWYGDRDEKIAENAVRWMESTMGPDKCQVKVVKGAEHALMFKSSVVIEVLEHLVEFWRDWE